jgi:hypothetical protein
MIAIAFQCAISVYMRSITKADDVQLIFLLRNVFMPLTFVYSRANSRWCQAQGIGNIVHTGSTIYYSNTRIIPVPLNV